jgi:ABC-2 type transport system permease protein
MSTIRVHRPGPRHVAAHRRRVAPHRWAAGWGTARLTARLIRRASVAAAAALGIYLAVEAGSFLVGYPDEASRAALEMWARDPSVRLLSGPGTAVSTLGGFVVWDAGLFLHLIVCAWGLTTATRVLRGDEDAGRAELVLTGPVGSGQALRAQLAVLFLACLAVGSVGAGALAVAGADLQGSALFGALMAGFAATVVGLAAVSSQLFETRGRALSASALVVAIALVLRVVANSGDAWAGLAWVTPFGWMDLGRAFGENRWFVLLAPLTAVALLATVATGLRQHRDTGDGLLASRRVPRSRSFGLGGPTAFAWRSTQRGLAGWVLALGISAGVFGALVRTLGDSLAKDPAFQRILAGVGMELSDLTLGFANFISLMLAVVIGVFAAFRMGTVAGEEAAGRAEQVLARPVRRMGWLAGHVLCLAGSVVALAAVTAGSMWLGGVLAGQGLSANDAFAGVFNTLPAVAVFAGLDVLVYATLPRLTVAAGGALVATAYVVEVVGPLLELPGWVTALSPFHHLAAVPMDPVDWGSCVAMLTIGIVVVGAGLVAFERRDLTTA